MIDSYIPTFSHTHIFLHIVRVINRQSYIKTIEDLRIKKSFVVLDLGMLISGSYIRLSRISKQLKLPILSKWSQIEDVAFGQVIIYCTAFFVKQPVNEQSFVDIKADEILSGLSFFTLSSYQKFEEKYLGNKNDHSWSSLTVRVTSCCPKSNLLRLNYAYFIYLPIKKNKRSCCLHWF